MKHTILREDENPNKANEQPSSKKSKKRKVQLGFTIFTPEAFATPTKILSKNPDNSSATNLYYEDLLQLYNTVAFQKKSTEKALIECQKNLKQSQKECDSLKNQVENLRKENDELRKKNDFLQGEQHKDYQQDDKLSHLSAFTFLKHNLEIKRTNPDISNLINPEEKPISNKSHR